MQKVVQGMAWAITKLMRVSGAETTSVCASVFIGQTEAPLTVRPYISKMTNSELLTMMIGGMAHIAGGVMAVYIGMLAGTDPAMQQFYAKHFLAASIMAAPATLLIAKILIPGNRPAADRRHGEGARGAGKQEHHRRRGCAAPPMACAWRSTSPPCCSPSSP